MGFYLGGPSQKKLQYFQEKYNARQVTGLISTRILEELKENEALICIMHNEAFEAAGLVYSWYEFERFNSSLDTRYKEWLIMDRSQAAKLAQIEISSISYEKPAFNKLQELLLSKGISI